MNANDIWVGNDYAYKEFRGRGENWVPGASRVRALRTFKQRDYYASQRARTMVEVLFIDQDTNEPRTNWDGDPIKRSVRARDIFMRWEEYEEEKERRERERERINREAQAREEAEQQAKVALIDKLERVAGMPRDVVTSVTPTVVYLNRSLLEEWLRKFNGTSHEVVVPVESLLTDDDIAVSSEDNEEDAYV